MPKVKRVCKVCGKEYKACATPSTYGFFSWRDVACCVEHYNTYLEQIENPEGQIIEETLDTNKEYKGIEVTETPTVSAECYIGLDDNDFFETLKCDEMVDEDEAPSLSNDISDDDSFDE